MSASRGTRRCEVDLVAFDFESAVIPLLGITIDAAYASFTEDTLGSLEIGKRADFVVLSKDIMTIPANRILATKVLATVIDGEVVYGEI